MRKKQTDPSDGNQHLNQPQLHPQLIPPIQSIEESSFQTPQQQPMVYVRNRYRAKPKKNKGNNLTPKDTPPPRHKIHCGVDHRGLHEDAKKKKDMVQGSSSTCPEIEDNVFQDLEIEGDQFQLPVISGGTLMIRDTPNQQQEEEVVVQGKGKQVVVASPEATLKPQAKEKKLRKKPSPKGKHIPKGKDMLLPKKKNESLWGEELNKSAVLFGYPHSWAAKVCESRDHEIAIKKLKHKKGGYWPLGEECKEVRDLVLDTGLANGIFNHQHEFDSIISCAFRERYWSETDTFHLPFGEMTITFDTSNV